VRCPPKADIVVCLTLQIGSAILVIFLLIIQFIAMIWCGPYQLAPCGSLSSWLLATALCSTGLWQPIAEQACCMLCYSRFYLMLACQLP
jgi:hypothetical protein